MAITLAQALGQHYQKATQTAVLENLPTIIKNPVETTPTAVTTVNAVLNISTTEPITPVFQFTDNAIKRDEISDTDTIFSNVFHAINRTVVFNEKWKSPNGCFDYAVDNSDHSFLINYSQSPNSAFADEERLLKLGEQVKSIDPVGRRLIITGTRCGVVIIFDRYVPDASRKGMYVCTAAPNVKKFPYIDFNNELSAKELIKIIGMTEYTSENKPIISFSNLGINLESIFQTCVEELTTYAANSKS